MKHEIHDFWIMRHAVKKTQFKSCKNYTMIERRNSHQKLDWIPWLIGIALESVVLWKKLKVILKTLACDAHSCTTWKFYHTKLLQNIRKTKKKSFCAYYFTLAKPFDIVRSEICATFIKARRAHHGYQFYDKQDIFLFHTPCCSAPSCS